MDNEFVICDVEEFQKHYLSFVPSPKEVDACVGRLVEEGDLRHSLTQEYCWDEFPTNPSQANGVENQVFRCLEPIFKAVSVCQLETRTRNKFKFRLCPDALIVSDILGSDHRIDACITSDNASLHTTGIAVVIELKKVMDPAITAPHRIAF